MFRKITLISAVLLLGLTFFAGCSDKDTTAPDIEGEKAFAGKGIAGIVYLGGEPVGTNQAEVFVYQGLILLGSDTTNSDGEYTIACEPGYYNVRCDLYSVPATYPPTVIDSIEEGIMHGTGWEYLNFYFYSE